MMNEEEQLKMIEKDAEFLADKMKELILKDRIGVMLLAGYKAIFHLERNGEETKIKCECEIIDGDKGLKLKDIIKKK